MPTATADTIHPATATPLLDVADVAAVIDDLNRLDHDTRLDLVWADSPTGQHVR